MESQVFVVLCTVPTKESGAEIAKQLVHEKLAACVNILSNVESIYSWEGNIEQSQEWLLIIKTQASVYQALEDKVISLHPYDCPEIIALPLQKGFSGYLKWVQSSIES